MGALLAWLDIETTGLNPDEDHLLEIACVVTDLSGQPIEEGEYHRVAALPDAWQPDDPGSWPVDPTVRDMHAVNGLWDSCRDLRRHSEDDLIDNFLCWIHMFNGEGITIHPAGSGVAGFDVPWLRARRDPPGVWPFHYRECDLRSIRFLLEAIGMWPERPLSPHRAMADVQIAIDTWIDLIDLLKSGTPHPAGDYRRGVGDAIAAVKQLKAEQEQVAATHVLGTQRNRAEAAAGTLDAAASVLMDLL